MTTNSVRMEAGDLINSLSAVADNLPKQLGIIASKTANRTKSIIAKEVSQRVAIKQKDVKKNITTKRRKTSAEVNLLETDRLPLREFGARQIKSGVTYKIDKRGGRKKIHGAFQGPRPGVMKRSWKGRVFKRVGKSRLPIQQLFGPSPWGVIVKNKRTKAIAVKASDEMKKQAAERLRYLKLKKSGAI